MPATMPLTIEVQTQAATEVIDVTARVEALTGGASGGSCHLFLRHTTAGGANVASLRTRWQVARVG